MTSVEPSPDNPPVVEQDSDPIYVLAVLLAWYEDQLKAKRAWAQAQMIAAGLKPGGREPVILDGEELGSVHRPKQEPRIAGFNGSEFLAWAQDHYPDEIEVVEEPRQVTVYEEVVRLRPAFQKSFKVDRKLDAVVGPKPNDKEPVPGLTYSTPKSTPTVNKNPDVIQAMYERLRNIVPAALTTTTTEENS